MSNSHELEIIRNLQEFIDWDMTPEEAVRLYLEWGNNWAGGKYVIRSKNDVVHYLVVNTWGDKPLIYLIKRNEEEAIELAKINLPEKVATKYLERNGSVKGVFALDNDLKIWLKSELRENNVN